MLPARRGDGRGYSKSFAIVPYLTPEEIGLMVERVKKERDKLLILLLFQTGLRISEALSITPESITMFEGYPVIHIIGKGKKKRIIACPEVLAYRIRSYCYEKKIQNGEKIFDISRVQA